MRPQFTPRAAPPAARLTAGRVVPAGAVARGRGSGASSGLVPTRPESSLSNAAHRRAGLSCRTTDAPLNAPPAPRASPISERFSFAVSAIRELEPPRLLLTRPSHGLSWVLLVSPVPLSTPGDPWVAHLCRPVRRRCAAQTALSAGGWFNAARGVRLLPAYMWLNAHLLFPMRFVPFQSNLRKLSPFRNHKLV